MSSVMLVSIGLVCSALVLYGIVPYSTKRIVLESELLPYDFFYSYTVHYCFGYGNYLIKIWSESIMNVTIFQRHERISLGPGEYREFVIERTNCVNMVITVKHKQYQTRSGTIEMSRRSI